MRSSYSPVLLAAAAFIAASAVSLRAALAQEDKPTEPKAAVPVPSADASDLLRQLDELYKRAIRRPPDVDLSAADLLKVRAEHAKLESEWRRAVEALAKTGDEYLAALGDAAPDARALYFRGVGKLRRAELTSAAESLALFEAAAESFQRYLDGTDAKAAFRADAEMHLGRALMFGRHVDDAIVHLVRAVGLLQEDGRHDDAGEAAAIAIWTRVAECRLCRENDVGLDRGERGVVEPQTQERRGRQVGDDDIRYRDQAAHDIARAGTIECERQRTLVAAGLEQNRALS